jgi:hypothetical protein
MMKIEGSVSISQRHGSADPDLHQNVMDPEHCSLCAHTWRDPWIWWRWRGRADIRTPAGCTRKTSLPSYCSSCYTKGTVAWDDLFQCFGDPHWFGRLDLDQGKLKGTNKKRKKYFMFWTAECSLLRAAGFSCNNLDVFCNFWSKILFFSI